MEHHSEIWAIAVALVLGTLCLMGWFARLYHKAGPNEALVVYGFRGTRIVKGGGTIIFPMVENARALSLELMSFDVAPEQDLYTRQGVAVTVEAVAQIKVQSDLQSIRTAAEQVLSKGLAEREQLIRLMMVGHLRGIVGQLTVEEIVKQPDMVAERMRSTCANDMSKMGLEVISFTIKEVRDGNEYITNMGRPDVARVRRDADVATAEAERDTAIRKAVAQREAAVARASADQQRVEAEAMSVTKQAEAGRDRDVKRAEYEEMIQRQKAQADKAYEIQTAIMQQQVAAEQVKITRAEREEQVKVQEIEIARREKELVATVLKQAEFERKRIEMLAEAEGRRLTVESAGKAAAIQQQGEAEANIILRKGEAEAQAMSAKAGAYQKYNQAAVADRLIGSLPDVVRALASPLANVDKITVVSTGDGNRAGLSKVTGDIAGIAAQVPALFESLSGLKLSGLLSKLGGMPTDDVAPDAARDATNGANSPQSSEGRDGR